MTLAAPAPPGWWRPVAPDERAAPARPAGAEGAPESRAAFVGLVAFTGVLLISPQSAVPALAPFRLALAAAALAIGALLLHRLLAGAPLTVLTREMWLAIALLALAVASVPTSLWPGGSVAVLAGLYVKSLMIFWLLANVVSGAHRLRVLAWALTLMTIPLAVTGVANYATGAFIPGQRVARIVGYDAPLTGNPNDLALTLNLLLPLAVALWLMRPRPAVRVFLAAVIALDVVAVVLTFSRAGFVTLAVVAAAYVWKLRRRAERRYLWAALALALVALPLLPEGYAGRLMTVLSAESDPTGSAQARRDDILAALAWVGRNPLIGAGLGQDILALNLERGAQWRPVHNVYLQYAVDLGLSGLAAFSLLLVACIRGAGRAERLWAGAPAAHLAGAIQISLIAFAVAALFHPSAYHFYFYYIAGLAVAARLIAGRQRGRRPA